jgi:hypothetical protein
VENSNANYPNRPSQNDFTHIAFVKFCPHSSQRDTGNQPATKRLENHPKRICVLKGRRMVVAARRQTAAFIREIESSAFRRKLLAKIPSCLAAQNLFLSIDSHF